MSSGEHDCKQTLREIERFLDGELEVDEQALVELHLSGCNPCMDRSEFRRHLKEMIASKCAGETPPPELILRVRALIQSHDTPTG